MPSVAIYNFAACEDAREVFLAAWNKEKTCSGGVHIETLGQNPRRARRITTGKRLASAFCITEVLLSRIVLFSLHAMGSYLQAAETSLNPWWDFGGPIT